MDTRPEQPLGLPQPLERTVDELLEVAQIRGDAIGHRPLEMVPHELIGIELRCVSRERRGPQARMRAEKRFDHGALMGSPAIPEQDHVTSQVPEELAQESGHFRGPDVLLGMEPGVQRDASSLRRDAESRDGRNLVPVPGAAQPGGLPPGRPGARDVRDQQEATLIEEHQMGPTPFGVFLYAATGNASNERFLPRFFGARGALASGSSIPASGAGGSRALDDT